MVVGRRVVGLGGGRRCCFLLLSVFVFLSLPFFGRCGRNWNTETTALELPGGSGRSYVSGSTTTTSMERIFGRLGAGSEGREEGLMIRSLQDIFDLPVYKHRWVKDPPPDPRHWAFLCAFIFFSFSFPCPLLLARVFRRTAVASLGMDPEKCGFGQQGAFCACAFFVTSWDCCSGAERTAKLDFGILSHHGAHSVRTM